MKFQEQERTAQRHGTRHVLPDLFLSQRCTPRRQGDRVCPTRDWPSEPSALSGGPWLAPYEGAVGGLVQERVGQVLLAVREAETRPVILPPVEALLQLPDFTLDHRSV